MLPMSHATRLRRVRYLTVAVLFPLVLACHEAFAGDGPDCKAVYAAASEGIGRRNTFATVAASDGSCKFSVSDPSYFNHPQTGIGTVRVLEHDGSPVGSYQRPNNADCRVVDGIGQKAEFCSLAMVKEHYSLIVFRNDHQVLSVDLSNWPAQINTAQDYARDIARQTLPAYGLIAKPAAQTVPSANDPAVALKIKFIPMADSGDIRAQLLLGKLYEYGSVNASGKTVPDYLGAAYWYQQAAPHEPRAAFALGLLYRDGHGVVQSVADALKLFTQAAQQGNSDAMDAAGMIYINQGVFWQAIPWMEKGEAAGNVQAANDLGVAQYAMGRQTLARGGVPRAFFDAARAAYERAATGGSCIAMMNLGGLYFNGDGVPQDGRQAQSWFARARDCNGALGNDLRSKAERYLQKSKNGELPPMLTPFDASGHAVSLTAADLVVSLGVLVIAADLLTTLASPTSTSEKVTPAYQLIMDANEEADRKYRLFLRCGSEPSLFCF